VASRQPSDGPARDSRWGGPKTALGAILLGAAALRLVGIQYGLPFGNLLNPDERTLVPRAWQMVHGAGGDPHPFFDYPSLFLYVLAPFEWRPDEPSYLAARLVAVAIGLAGVGAAWWLGSRAYGTVAGAVAAAVTAVATVHVSYSHMAVTDVLLALGVTVTLALLARGQIELAGLAAGLAMGAKWPGLILIVPLVVVAWKRWQRLALALGLMLAAFCATTPFLFAHPAEVAGDFWRVRRLAQEGWLGFEHDHVAPIAFVGGLWDSLGPTLVIAAIGLVLALTTRRSTADLALGSFALAYYLNLATLGSHFDRYLLPLIPVLGALAGRLRSLAPVTLLLLVVPLVWSVRADERLVKTDTRVVAHRWIESNVPRGARVAVDPSTPELDRYRVVALALPGPGRTPDELRDLGRLRVLGVRYVVISGAVTDRVRAAAEDYPEEIRFYDSLEQDARRLYRLEPDGDLAGPWVAVYGL
jgi:4-amino-4-deoxy-L-arabinose transferase-like glycosyltransferase